MKRIALGLALALAGLPGVALAAEKQIGNACASDQNSADFDTIAQCQSGIFVKAPLFMGSATGYACTGGVNAGLMRWNGSAIQVCNGTAWASPGAGGSIDDLSDAATDYTTYYNIFLGGGAGAAITTGAYNSGLGYQALSANTSGEYNTALGFQALYQNLTGSRNTAIGRSALYSNTSGSFNTAVGYPAMYSNTSGNYNSAFGIGALQYATTASNNNAFGYNALQGAGYDYNNAFGSAALSNLTNGIGNSAFGHNALSHTTTGSYNVGIGINVGSTTLATGSNNILIGTSAAVDTPAAGSSNWLNIGNMLYGDLSAAKIGINQLSPQATLDVNGYLRLAKNSAQPAACAASNDGALALTTQYTLCVCKGSTTSWLRANDGSTACSW